MLNKNRLFYNILLPRYSRHFIVKAVQGTSAESHYQLSASLMTLAHPAKDKADLLSSLSASNSTLDVEGNTAYNPAV